MLKFVYLQILLQFRTYSYYGTNLCRIYRDKYLTVCKIPTRLTQKIQIRIDDSWCWSSNLHKSSSVSESTAKYISVSSSDCFGRVGSGLPHTRSHDTSRYFFLAGVAPSSLTSFQLIIFFRSETDQFSTSFEASKVSSSLIYWFPSLYSCVFFLCVSSRITRVASFISLFTYRMV